MKLEFNSINKYFEEFHVLKDVSFSVKSGQIFGYLGRNGAGKTTSIRIMMDVFKASSGEILMDGKLFDPKNYKIGYLPEERGMYSKTKVMDQLIYFAMLRGSSRSDARKSATYWAKKFEIEEYLNRKLDTLSKGNQQKVQITQAFLNEPDILILDEPFSGLDPVNSKVFQDALVEYISEDKIIIFSSHQMSYVETFCDDIAIIDKGRIVLNGSLSTIKKDWGKNKLRIDSAQRDELERHLETLNVSLESDKKSLIVACPESLTKQQLLKSCVDNNLEVSYFDDYIPSLQDIFVEVAREDHE